MHQLMYFIVVVGGISITAYCDGGYNILDAIAMAKTVL